MPLGLYCITRAPKLRSRSRSFSGRTRSVSNPSGGPLIASGWCTALYSVMPSIDPIGEIIVGMLEAGPEGVFLNQIGGVFPAKNGLVTSISWQK